MADCTGVIAQLFIYPIKSCAGIELTQAELSATGLNMDREWRRWIVLQETVKKRLKH
jgi:uncharacterized protein YcbX